MRILLLLAALLALVVVVGGGCQKTIHEARSDLIPASPGSDSIR